MATKARIQLLLLSIPQNQIVQELGVSPAYVSRCVNGKQRPSRRLIEAVCHITGLSEDVLFGEEGNG